jgi:hypothetical protein
MTSRKPPIPVRIGQIWADKNQWNAGRTVRVVEIDGRHAVTEVVTEAEGPLAPSRCTIGKRSRVLHDDRGLRGYRLLSEAPAAGA